MAAVLAIPTLSLEISARRYLGLAAVGSLHLAVLYILLTALNIIPSPIAEPDVQFRWLPQDRSIKVTNPMPPVVTPNRFFEPARPVPRPPVIVTAEPTPNPLPPQNPPTSGGNQNPVAQTAGPTLPARGIAGTHTIPHYPMLALRLGHAGNVRLKLTVDEQGRVVAAELLNSSGHDELDDAAIAWVKAHWRYTPALQNGTAVESSMSVVVTFRLDQAR